MGRLIDADRLKAHYCWWAGGSKEMSIDEAKKTFDTIIDIQPTVDAEPVVRCDDCIYRDGKTPGQPNILCWQMHADDFCSYGTRVDESKEQSKGETKEREEDESD